jgi:hypothetical protein
MRFKKSSGINESEKILADLCEQSFLSFWTYPNLYRSKAKELADLIVVFGDHVIIFSDKCCQYPSSGDSNIDWKRWFKKSILDSAAQITRAENWLIKHPTEIYLDAKCTDRFPIAFPNADKIKFHRVCITLGAVERSQEATGTKALRIRPAITDDEQAFTIGKLTSSNGWAHVLGASELEVLLAELSTIHDFVEYLSKKEVLFDSGRFIEAECETDLLAYYLWHDRDFKLQSVTSFVLKPNLWNQVQSHPSFIEARTQNETSVFWDNLIEYLNTLYMKEELEHGNENTPAEHEVSVRVLASESRFSRRLLTKWILKRVDKEPNGYVSSFHPSINQDDVLYVLLVGPGAEKSEYTTYREHRKKQLTLRCYAAKAASINHRIIFGFGFDARGFKGQSEDFILIDTGGWTEDDLSRAEKIRQDLGYFVDGISNQTRVSEWEYPG